MLFEKNYLLNICLEKQEIQKNNNKLLEDEILYIVINIVLNTI